MQRNLSQEIIKPCDCTFAIGIPTTQEAFFEDQTRDDKGFAKMFSGVWYKYEHEIIREFINLKLTMDQLHVQVILNLTLNKLENFFQSKDRKVIILFSHWENDKIEFADGFAGTQKIIEHIPLDANQTIDLSVCHPQNLTLELDRKRPDCLVKYSNEKLTPFLWLKFYWVVFRHLNRKSINYTQALEEVTTEFLRTTHKSSSPI